MVLNVASTMAANVRKQPRTSVAPPPRTLNVQKFAESRASELESLHSIVSDRLNNDFRYRRNKRRRTTGYDNRVTNNRGRKRQKFRVVSDKKNKSLNGEMDHKKVPRHIRRKAELKKNPETGFCSSGDGTKRLRTHVWHVKRFTMTKLWGFHLPLGLHGRGRGSRALLKWFKHGALVHDASYYAAVQLEGPEDSLLSLLEKVLMPSPSVLSKDLFHSVLSGVVYGKAVLHHVGVPVAQSIAPVNYMWRSIHQQKTGVDDTEGSSSNGHSKDQSVECPSFRQLWVWIHASAFSEGYDALKFACVKQMNETGMSINCSSLEGQLAKLEVMGSKSFQLLQKLLHQKICFSDNSLKSSKCSDVKIDTKIHIWKSCVLESEECTSSHAIMSLTVDDPRTLPKSRIAIAPEATPSNIVSNLPEYAAKKNATLAEIPNQENDLITSLWLTHEINDSALWDASNGISPPIEENFLCMEKHHLRLESFCLGDTNLGALNNSTTETSSRSCPIILLKDVNLEGSLIGWSIVLPISWAKAFWIPLVSNGVHAVGLREKHWIASEVGLPYFPSDFADSNAYSYFKETEATASDLKAESRPLIQRPSRVPIPPPWSCVRLAFDEGSTRVGDSHPSKNICSDDAVSENSLTKSVCQNCNVASRGHHVLPFEGFVARTSNMLTDFLNEIRGDHLLLCPFPPDKKTTFSKFMKDETKIRQGQNGSSQLNKDRKLCFLRVLLHAYREGNFEEGAVVCAPQPTDIKLFTSRSENNDEGLQMPQSFVSLYFREQFSGICELHIPDDPISRESHRWPIGFVTSGFVRGSKKPTAGALCEATLLARLREEQWKEIPMKCRRKEIYVLVRNLRSTAYRLALATIVLEQQGEDVEFM